MSRYLIEPAKVCAVIFVAAILQVTIFSSVEILGGTPDVVVYDPTYTIDNKKALRFEYEDNETRYLGCAIERGDVLIYVAIGCQKARFSEFYAKFEKCIMGVTCNR